MLEEGVKVFTNIHMNWDGIQGIPLFELDWEEDTPLILKPKCRAISANILEVVEKEFNDSEAIFSSHPTVPFVVTLWWHQKRHILSCVSVVTTLPSTSTSDMDTIQYLSSEANLIGFRRTAFMLTSISRTVFIRFALGRYHPHDCPSPQGMQQIKSIFMVQIESIFLFSICYRIQ